MLRHTVSEAVVVMEGRCTGRSQRSFLSLLESGATVDLMLEVQLETLFSISRLSFVGAVDARSFSSRASVYPGLIGSTAGHPIIARSIEVLLQIVAVETHATTYTMDESSGFLGRFFPIDSLEFWRTRLPRDICPVAVAVHRSLGETSPYDPLQLGVVSFGDEGTALFMLVSGGAVYCERFSRNSILT